MVDKNPQLSALEVGELDLFVESMVPWEIANVGNQSWVDWHIRLQKLNQQAVLEAASMQEELTKETLISCGKLPVLVQEAICIQVWRLKVYPQILKLIPKPENTFGIYMVLYHEAAAVGLLETVLFHEDGAACVADVAVDLFEYAADQMTALLQLLDQGYLDVDNSLRDTETATEELERQRKDLQFDIGMRCISIVRYLSEHMEAAGAGVLAPRLYGARDAPSLAAELLSRRPWRRARPGREETFDMGRWSTMTEDTLLHRSEAQLWLVLRQLLLEPRLATYYTVDDTRRNVFCRLQSHLTEPVLDQVPPLGELKLFLCRLAAGAPPPAAAKPRCTLIEVVPEIKEAYLKQVSKKCKTIAKAQLARFNMDGSDQSRALAKKLLDSYTSDAALALDGGGARCGRCGEKAAKKCSRCKTEWYCGRECQVQQWPKHKELCDQFSKIAI